MTRFLPWSSDLPSKSGVAQHCCLIRVPVSELDFKRNMITGGLASLPVFTHPG